MIYLLICNLSTNNYTLQAYNSFVIEDLTYIHTCIKLICQLCYRQLGFQCDTYLSQNIHCGICNVTIMCPLVRDTSQEMHTTDKLFVSGQIFTASQCIALTEGHFIPLFNMTK